MFLSKVKLVMTAAAVVAALAVGAAALAQSGLGRPKDGTGKSEQVGSSSYTYHILVSRNGEPPRTVAVVEMTGDTPIRVDAPGARILIEPKRDGEPSRHTAAERRHGDVQVEVADEPTGRFAADAVANPSRAKSSRTENDREQRKIVLTRPKAMDVAVTQRYVGQVHSRRYINVCSLVVGYLEEIKVRAGQPVKKGDPMFKIVPTINKSKLDAVAAEAELARLEFMNTKKLSEEKPPAVSQNEVALFKAKLDRANAKRDLARAELEFTNIRAAFRRHRRQLAFAGRQPDQGGRHAHDVVG